MNLSPLVWLAVGIVIMAMEILLPGFVIFWFGLGGLLTALGVYTGLLRSAEAQWLFFFVSSLALLGLWFGVLKKKLAGGKTADSRDPTLIDLKGVCTRAVRPGMPGEVELYDNFHGIKNWQAESADDIPEGEEIRVVEARGIKLVVAKLS